MEIERKFLINQPPENLAQFPHHNITQAYLCTEPVVRIRQWDDDYILTYKSKGMRSRIEEELPLNETAFHHLLKKADGNIISKTRYVIPDVRNPEKYKIELDFFHGVYEGICLAEVEFSSETEADHYLPPQWFKKEVTYDKNYHNSNLSTMDCDNIKKLVQESSI